MSFSNKTGDHPGMKGDGMSYADKSTGKDFVPRHVDDERPGSRATCTSTKRSSSTESFIQTAKFGGR